MNKFEHGQDVYYKGEKWKFGCYTVEPDCCILLVKHGHRVCLVSEVSSKSQEEIELEEAKKKQVEQILNKYKYHLLHEGQFKRALIEMQKSGELAEIVLPLKEN